MARPTSIYLDELIAEFLADNRDRLRTKASRDGYRNTLSQLARHLNSTPLHKVTEQHLADWCTGDSLSPNWIAARRGRVTRFFTWAHRRGHVPTNPASELAEVVKPRARNVRMGNWLTAEEARLVIDTCPPTHVGERDRLLLTLGFHTGLRLMELRNITWSQVNLPAREITLRPAGAKGEKPAIVGITDALYDELRAWEARVLASGVDYATAPVVPAVGFGGFGTERYWFEWDRVVSEPTVRLACARASVRLGRRFTPHDMRRTLAGILESRGMDIQDISAVLRHDNVATTQRYLEKNPRRGAKAMGGFTL